MSELLKKTKAQNAEDYLKCLCSTHAHTLCITNSKYPTLIPFTRFKISTFIPMNFPFEPQIYKHSCIGHFLVTRMQSVMQTLPCLELNRHTSTNQIKNSLFQYLTLHQFWFISYFTASLFISMSIRSQLASKEGFHVFFSGRYNK